MKKNLVYYCYFPNEEPTEYTKYNLKLLKHYAHVFDGQKILKIAVDNLSEDNSKKADYFSFIDNANIEFVQNHKDDRESSYFISSISEITDTDSLTFYAHNKGQTLEERNTAVEAWLCSLYFFNLENEYMDEMVHALTTDKVFSGALRKTINCEPWVCSDWHYSGTFFWFNTKKLFSIDGWNDMQTGRFSVEEYPGYKVPVEQSHCTFLSRPDNFNSYGDPTWKESITETNIGKTMVERFIALSHTVFEKPGVIG